VINGLIIPGLLFAIAYSTSYGLQKKHELVDKYCNKTGHVRINVTTRRVRETMFAVGKHEVLGLRRLSVCR
jgi:hypothetical protein